MKSPDFKGFKKITNEEAELLWPLGVVWCDHYKHNSYDWCTDHPYEIVDTFKVLSIVKDMPNHQFYLQIEDDSPT